jgi:hypothetical protein
MIYYFLLFDILGSLWISHAFVQAFMEGSIKSKILNHIFLIVSIIIAFILGKISV